MYNILFLISILPLSLVFEGIKRKLMARMSNRVGPPISQPFYDVLKLFKKQKSDSKATDNPFFNIIPILLFLVNFSLFLFIPLSILHFKYDFILFIYMIVLSGALYTLAGFSSNSPFGVLGSTRDLLLMVCYETIFTICIFSFVVFANVESLLGLSQTFMILKLPLASLCLYFVVLVEARITPLDTSEAEAEILHGVDTEFSGRSLGFLELAKYLKLTFFVFLLSSLFFNFSNIFWFLISSFAILFLIVFSQATSCRYRLDQAFNFLMFVLFLAIVEFIRINYLVW